MTPFIPAWKAHLHPKTVYIHMIFFMSEKSVLGLLIMGSFSLWSTSLRYMVQAWAKWRWFKPIDPIEGSEGQGPQRLWWFNGSGGDCCDVGSEILERIFEIFRWRELSRWWEQIFWLWQIVVAGVCIPGSLAMTSMTLALACWNWTLNCCSFMVNPSMRQRSLMPFCPSTSQLSVARAVLRKFVLMQVSLWNF